MCDPTLLSLSEQVQMIRNQDISSAELFDAVLCRYERHNPVVNAVVVTDIESARARALEADRSLKRRAILGPLHGVPITIKESYDWVGTPSTFGVKEFSANFPTKNAAAVDRLLRAGAIIYGKTNVPAHLGDVQTFNDVYGTTNNPWDVGRVPGGSSGGSAVSVATGMAAMELGSDIAGSLRNPAHYCGVFAHKPSYGRVPLLGHNYPGFLATRDMEVGGPITRSADDLELAMSQLSSSPWNNSGSLSREKVKLSDYRVAVMLESDCVEQDPELTELLHDSVEMLSRAGLHVSTGMFPKMNQWEALDLGLLLLRGATFRGNTRDELVLLERDADRYDAGSRDRSAIAAKGATLSHRDWYLLHNQRERNRVVWQKFFEEFDLLLCPTSPAAAHPHNHGPDRFSSPYRLADSSKRSERTFWALWPGSAYLPSTVAPVGLTRAGLPGGLQIIAPFGRDELSVAFSRLVERELGGFKASPIVS